MKMHWNMKQIFFGPNYLYCINMYLSATKVKVLSHHLYYHNITLNYTLNICYSIYWILWLTVCLSGEWCSDQCHLSRKLTIFGFFISFMTRISFIMSSFLGCFCRLICLMATCETEHPIKRYTHYGHHIHNSMITQIIRTLFPNLKWLQTTFL